MKPMLTLHKPYYDTTKRRWVLQAQFFVKGQPVTIYLHTTRNLGARVERVVKKHYQIGKNAISFGGETAMCLAGRCPDAAFAGIWEGMDNVMNVVGDVASNPIIAGAVSAIPYGALVVAGVNATVGAYKITRHYTSKKVRDKNKRAAVAKQMAKMNADAAAGVPQAVAAKQQLAAVAKVDKTRRAALQGDPAALKWMAKVREGVAKKSPQALEAYALVDGLQKAFGRPERSARWPDPRDFFDDESLREDAGDISKFATSLVAEYDLDQGTHGAADEIGAQLVENSYALRGQYDPKVQKLVRYFGRILKKRPVRRAFAA